MAAGNGSSIAFSLSGLRLGPSGGERQQEQQRPQGQHERQQQMRRRASIHGGAAEASSRLFGPRKYAAAAAGGGHGGHGGNGGSDGGSGSGGSGGVKRRLAAPLTLVIPSCDSITVLTDDSITDSSLRRRPFCHEYAVGGVITQPAKRQALAA